MTDAFVPRDPDHDLSPHTGLNRRHWIDAARHALRLAFRHVPDADHPITFPAAPGRSYPQPDAPDWQHRSKTLEGLRRTLCLAAPLLRIEPDLAIDGIAVGDYYARHVADALTPGHPAAIPRPGSLGDGFYQFTCELGGLCQDLLLYPELVWPRLDPARRDAVADTLSAWGHQRSQPHNWRFFNVTVLTFLKANGYPIDDALLAGHLDHLHVLHHRGGWYDDGHYDLYSAWVFHQYAQVWNHAWGRANDPARAAVHDDRFRRFMRTYPLLFARDGRMPMWGRSVCYRFAAACVFPLAFLGEADPRIDAGSARRLCSGMLMQFLPREDVWQDGMPGLGFYRPWEPAVQPYSSTASPYWAFMTFQALALPADSPFWNEPEREGFWQTDRGVSTTHLPAAHLHLAHHAAGGDTELRPSGIRSPNPHYDRLVYHTRYPREAEDPAGATANSYAIRSLRPDHAAAGTPFVTHRQLLGGVERDRMLHRSLQLGHTGHPRYTWIDLAEVPLEGGALRIDRVRAAQEHELRLGHFGLPHGTGHDVRVERRSRGGQRAVVVRAGGDALALVAVHGWDGADAATRPDLHAAGPWSTLPYAHRRDERMMPPPLVLVTLLLFRHDGGRWTDDGLFAVGRVEVRPPEGDALLTTRVTLADGRTYTARFDPLAHHVA